MKKHEISEEDRRFREEVETCRLSPADFDHKAHVRLAYTYLAESDVEAATDRMRSALLVFLRHHGVPITKYHETLTRAWILAVRHFMALSPVAASADAFIANDPRILDSKIMMTHYSAELLFSDEARAKFVEPNLEAIPEHEKTSP